MHRESAVTRIPERAESDPLKILVMRRDGKSPVEAMVTLVSMTTRLAVWFTGYPLSDKGRGLALRWVNGRVSDMIAWFCESRAGVQKNAGLKTLRDGDEGIYSNSYPAILRAILLKQ